MSLQLSVAARNAELDAIETAAGTAAVLKIYTGSVPANCAASATGTVLATCTLPSDWMAAASGGVKSLSGTWQDTSADNAGTAGWFGLWDSGVTTRHMQGTVTATGGGGDMTVDNAVFAAGQLFSITTFDLTAANS